MEENHLPSIHGKKGNLEPIFELHDEDNKLSRNTTVKNNILEESVTDLLPQAVEMETRQQQSVAAVPSIILTPQSPSTAQRLKSLEIKATPSSEKQSIKQIHPSVDGKPNPQIARRQTTKRQSNYQDLTAEQLSEARNPFQFSTDPHLDLVKMDTEIGSQKVVPFSRAPIVQSLFNPDYPEELITVQCCIVVRNLSKLKKPKPKAPISDDSSSDSSDSDQDEDVVDAGQQLTKCTQNQGGCGGDMVAVCDISHKEREKKGVTPVCVVCLGKQLVGQRYFECSKQGHNLTCPPCNLRNYKSAMLRAKVCDYQKKDSYVIWPSEGKDKMTGGTAVSAGRHVLGRGSPGFDLQELPEVEQNKQWYKDKAETRSGSLAQARQRAMGAPSPSPIPVLEVCQVDNLGAETRSRTMDDETREKEFEALYDLTKERQMKSVRLTDFATLREAKTKPQHLKHVRSYALVSFWRYENDNFVVYKSVRIDNPLFSEPAFDKLVMKTFLHLDDSNNLFYFAETRTGHKKAIALYYLETLEGPEAYGKMNEYEYEWKKTVPACKRIDMSQGQMLCRDADVQHLFKVIFDTRLQVDATEVLPCNVIPKVVKLRGQRYLVLKTKWAKAAKLGTLTAGPTEWQSTRRDNLFFINLETDSIDFTVYDADLFIGILHNDVYFLRKHKIIEVAWDTPVKTELKPKREQQQTMGSKLRSVIKNDTLRFVQQAKRVFQCNCSILEEEFRNKNDEFKMDLDEALRKATLLEACFHANNQRISINYSGVGLFTYELVKSQPLQTAQLWQGTIGDLLVQFDLSLSEDCTEVTLQNFENDDGLYSTVGEGGTLWHESSDGCHQCKVAVWVTSDTRFVLEGLFDLKAATFKGHLTKQSDSEEDDLKFKSLFGSDYHPQLHKTATFSFSGLNHADQAFQMFDYGTRNQAVFCLEAPNGHQYACGDLHVKDKDKSPGYSSFRVELYDLDRDLSSFGNDRQAMLDDKIKLECLVPDSFKESTDSNGLISLPALLMTPVRLIWEQKLRETNKDIEKKIKFQCQMFYQYQTTYKTNTLFLQGFSNKTMNETNRHIQKRWLFPQWASLPSEERIVVWPLLCYKTSRPMDNELIVCNLAQNGPKKIINIYPYRFIQFIEMGMNSERYYMDGHKTQPNTCIYFLVGKTRRDKDKINTRTVMRVMCYKEFPFKFNDSVKADGFLSEPQISIFSGEIDINNFDRATNEKMYDALADKKYDFNRFLKEKIRNATLIQREMADGIAILLVLQLIDGIVSFNMNNGDVWCSKTQHPECTMLKFVMQRSPYEEVYFVERNQDTHCDQIVRLNYQGGDTPTKSIAIKFIGEQLLAYQVSQEGDNDLRSHKRHSIMLIDSDFLFETYVCEESQDPIFVSSVDLKHLDGFSSALRYLQNSEWHNVILHARGITAMEEDSTTGFLTSKTISVQGAFGKHFEFLGYQTSRTKQKHDESTKNKVLNLASIAWSNETMTDVEEGDVNYLMIENGIFSRRIDLMRPDQHLQLVGTNKMVLVGNSFIAMKLQAAPQFLLFSQKTFQNVRTLCYQDLVPATHVVNNVQFFYAQKLDCQRKLKVFLLKFDGEIQGVDVNLSQLSESLLDQFRSLLKEDENSIKEEDLGDDIGEGSDDLASGEDDSNESAGEQMQQPQLLRKIFSNQVAQNLIIEQKKELLQFDNYVLVQDHGRASHEMKMAVSPNEGSVSFFHSIKPKEQTAKPTQLLQPKDVLQGFTLQFQEQNTYLVAFDLTTHIDRHEQRSLHYFMTNDYIVIHTTKHLFWVKQSDVYKQQQSFEAVFNRLPFHDFDHSVSEEGFQAFACTKHNVDIAEKGELRENVIQVSFADVAILWCLKENKEVVFAEHISQFASYDVFTQTGLLPHTFDLKDDSKLMKNAEMIAQNEHGTLMLQMPSHRQQSGCLFRNFAIIDIYEIIKIKKSIERNLFVPRIDLHSAFANFNGKSFFEIFMEEPDYLKMISQQVEDKDLQSKKRVDQSGTITDNIMIRQLFWTLQLPTRQNHNNRYGMLGCLEIDPSQSLEHYKQSAASKNKSKRICKDYISLCRGKSATAPEPLKPITDFVPQKSPIQHVLEAEELSHLLDPFIKLLMMSEEIRLGNLIAQIQQFKKVFSLNSKYLKHFLEQSMFENEITKEVETVPWVSGDKMITFWSNHTLMGKQQIFDHIDQAQKRQLQKPETKVRNTLTCSSLAEVLGFTKQWEKPLRERKMVHIQIKILEIEWLSTAADQDQFYKFLQSQRDNQIFNNSLIITILSKQKASFIIYGVFSVFLALMIASMSYFGTYLFETPSAYASGDDGKLRIFIHFLSFILVCVEIRNLLMSESKPMGDRLWNFFNYVQLMLTNYVLIEHASSFDPTEVQELAQIASVAVVTQWIVFISWMRLSEHLAFYVIMVHRTVKDILLFLVMFFTSIAMFANAIYILNQQRFYQVPGSQEEASTAGRLLQEEGGDPLEPIVVQAFKNGVLNACLDQWMVGLGEFNTDPYEGAPKIIWIYFILSTMFTQIIFLNMLVAIMGKTFEETTAIRAQLLLQSKTKLYAEYNPKLPKSMSQDEKRFLYVVQPIFDLDDAEGEEEAIQSKAEQVDSHAKQTEKKIKLVDATQNKILGDVTDIQKQLLTVQESFSNQQRTMENIIQALKQQQQQSL